MKSLLFLAVLFAPLILFPVTESFSQAADSGSTIAVITTSSEPYIYKNLNDRAVVVGEIENKNSLTAMTGIVIVTTFFDRSGNIVDTVEGSTVLDVISANSISPYMISSQISSSGIASASVEIKTFRSSPTKEAGLQLGVTDIYHDDKLFFSGTIKNTANITSSNTTVYLAFYDVFDPPRPLHVESIPVGNIPSDQMMPFEFSGMLDARAVKLKMFSESDILQSDAVDIKIPPQEIPTELVTISNLSVTNSDGKNTFDISVGSTVEIGSDLIFQTTVDERIQPYVYYVQIKQLGKIPFVEFLSNSTGIFHGTFSESASVRWTPDTTGAYYIETFVWDPSAVPIASPRTPTIIVVS